MRGERSGEDAVELRDFRPVPLLRNRHVQTILGNLLKGPARHMAAREQIVTLTDGDQIVLHDSCAPGWRSEDPITLLVHGLGGSHRSGHVERMPHLLLPRGVRAVRIDLRGCGRGVGLARRFYNGGCSGDVRAALAELHRLSPASPLFLVGFSLGGNIVLKLAGEAAVDPVPGLARVAAVAPPVDLERCAELLGLARNRIYEQHFVRILLQQVRDQRRYFPDLACPRFPPRLTIRQFDDLFTAPRSGYADALDYYRRAASRPLLPQIRVPTLILAARDDPFVAVEPLESMQVPANVEVHIVRHGGHLGFLGWDGRGVFRWAERCVADWLTHP